MKQVEQVEQGDAFAFNLLGSGLTCMYVGIHICICIVVCIYICINNVTVCRSATALMEVERATPPGFEEEILKPPEVTIPIAIIILIIPIILAIIIIILLITMVVNTLTQALWSLLFIFQTVITLFNLQPNQFFALNMHLPKILFA